jgi:hypothetical protein
VSSLAPPLLERAEAPSRRPRIGPADDAFEHEANALAERIAWRRPSPGGAASDGTVPDNLRETVEAELPYDFSAIRLHADGAGDTAARSLGAKAVTLGSDVAFSRGAYEPGSDAGRRLVVHELVHAAQQGAAPPKPRAGARVARSPTGVAQRRPGDNAKDSWNDLVVQVVFDAKPPELKTRGEEATRRFLELAEGARLINTLWHLAHPPGKRVAFRIVVHWVNDLPPQLAGKDAAEGVFDPRDENASRYDVYVKDQTPTLPGSIMIGGLTASGIGFAHTDPESEMGTTLQHELLHVEFVRELRGGYDTYGEPRTGHGAHPEKDTDPWFLEHETAAQNQMDALEARIQKRAEEERRRRELEQQAEERRKEEEEARRRPPVESRRDTGPSFVGGQVVAEGGAVIGLGEARGTAILGADLLLGKLDAFHVGPRGIYLSPGHVLVGGVAGVRLINPESPIFFDLEAGIVAEVSAPEAERLTRHFAVLAGGGLGHEFGTTGTRFFVKVGGFALVSDTGQAGGAATAGAGVRF